MENPDLKNSGSYTEHLEVLRGKIISVLVFFCLSAALLFFFAEATAGFLLAPLEGLGVSLDRAKLRRHVRSRHGPEPDL